MKLETLLRALRKCEQLPEPDIERFQDLRCGELTFSYDLYDERIKHLTRIADKLEARIVKRFNAIPLCAICSGILVRTVEEELGISGKPTGILK